MDIFSHAFWTAVAAKNANSKIKHFKNKKISVFWATAWGVLPDIFAFAPVFISATPVFLLGVGDQSVFTIPHPSELEPVNRDTLFIFKLTHSLYNISHSAIIFFLVLGLIYFFTKKIRWEMLGWLLHILIDLPTHSYKFYPTPILWPLANWKFDGIPWSTPWFMVLNLSAILIVTAIYIIKRKSKNG